MARLTIKPSVRGKDYGTQLAQAILRQALTRSPSVISLNVFRDNEAAIALYNRSGFIAAERELAGSASNVLYMVYSSGRSQEVDRDIGEGGNRASLSGMRGLMMYLSAKAISEMEATQKTHFLNELAVRNNKSLGDAVGLGNIGVHLITVQPGHYSTEFHCHLMEEECVYVLSGHGKATIGEETYPLGPGDFVGCPANGVAHTMQAEGDEPLVCLVIGQRLTHDVVDYPALGKRLYRRAGEWNMVEHSDIQHIKR